MRAICAWCRAEGSPADLGVREPLEDPGVTHGLCQRHLTKFLSEARSRPSADLRLLIVVGRSDQSLYEYLTRAMLGVEGVQVTMDRRQGERRRAPRAVCGERRETDRRQPRDVVHSVGCTFVRFPAFSGVLGAIRSA